MKTCIVTVLFLAPFLFAEQPSGHTNVHHWELSTATVNRVLTLQDGNFVTTSWTDLITHRSLVGAAPSSELSVLLDGRELTGISGGWSFVAERKIPQENGAAELDLTLRHGDLEATKSYVTYQGSSIIREWVTLKNAGSRDMTIQDPAFLNTSTRFSALTSSDFFWMTGGENQPGSWQLKKEALVLGADRKFDSYDPFPGIKDSKFEFKMGSASYAPWYALYDRSTKQGVFIGFDYFGRWTSHFKPASDQSVSAQLKLAGYRITLKPRESITTPKAFTGLYRDDLDNAGNEVLDWEYQYLWDYTRPGWFPAIRMLGFWWNGTPWKDPGHTWVGGNGDGQSAYRKVFRVADLMSEVGADVYHRDWGWWTRAGDWDGPDFKSMGEYLHKRDMGQLIYAFLYTVDARSRFAQAHPDWVIKDTLDMSQPDVVSHLENQLDQFAQKFGPFEWRNDSVLTIPHGSDDTSLLAQDQNFRKILKNFLDKHPEDAFQGVNDGGNNTGYDYARYASSISFSDGAVGILRNYWASLILPPDKSSDIPDNWQPDKYDKSIWRGLLTINFDMTGDTWDPAKIEGIRQLVDIYHYLGTQGLVGRWVHVYRPNIEGDDPTMYFERLNRNGSQGIVIPKHPAPGPVTIRPKGLNPTLKYLISFQESDRSETRTGASLMQSGIAINKMLPGELIYLNVPFHPGSSMYQKPPTTPVDLRMNAASNLGFPGVELRWSSAKDEHWISYYEVLRDGKPVDKVAKGTYYFDHSAGADLTAHYAVRAVNGGGLTSSEAQAPNTNMQTASVIVLDDATAGGVSYSGNWKHEQNVQPAYQGTLSSSDEQGASISFSISGSQFTWYTRMCAECGQAEISVDGHVEGAVDTYSADDIFGAGICTTHITGPGAHQVTITVLGKHTGTRGTGTRVYVDGVNTSRF